MNQAVYVLDALRTPFGKLQGSLMSVRPDDLASGLLQAALARFPMLEIDALWVGCGNQAGEDNRNVARHLVLQNNLAPTVHALTFNSLCSSGMEALIAAARMIRLGEADICVVMGVESMSRSPFIEHRLTGERVDSTIGWRFTNPKMANFYEPNSMIQTAELLAKKYAVTRLQQDEYAHESRMRYQRAKDDSYWISELIAVPLDNEKTLAEDEQHRCFSLETLGKLPPILSGGNAVSLGNSARAGDGAALVMLASEKALREYSLTPKAEIYAWASAAVHPDDMGLASVAATQKLLKQQQLSASHLDIVELSESFAVQALLNIQQLELDAARVNMAGGSISVGNPTGAGSLRLITTLINHFQQHTHFKNGLASSCAGLGLGASVWLKQ